MRKDSEPGNIPNPADRSKERRIRNALAFIGTAFMVCGIGGFLYTIATEKGVESDIIMAKVVGSISLIYIGLGLASHADRIKQNKDNSGNL